MMGKLETVTDALDHDGASVECDGRTWRVTTEPDDVSLLDEAGEDMWCGRIEWSTGRNEYGWCPRPDGMNGRARILTRDSYANLWWQSPADLTDIAAAERVIRDLLEYGYMLVIVETDDGRSAAIGGVEPFPDDGSWREIVADIVAEILDEIRREEENAARVNAAAAMFAVVGP